MIIKETSWLVAFYELARRVHWAYSQITVTPTEISQQTQIHIRFRNTTRRGRTVRDVEKRENSLNMKGAPHGCSIDAFLWCMPPPPSLDITGPPPLEYMVSTKREKKKKGEEEEEQGKGGGVQFKYNFIPWFSIFLVGI